MGLFSKKEKKELVAVFDIGSSGIGGALFYTNGDSSPNIVFSVREPIKFQETVDFDKLLHNTLDALEEVSRKMSLSGFGAAKKTFCILSSPWYASQTRVILLEKNVPFVLTSKLADSLIQKEIALFEEEHINKDIQDDAKPRLIEFKNMKTMLNGYETSKPIGEKAKKVEMILFMSMSQEYLLKKFEETIAKHIHPINLKFSSFVMASFTVARDTFIHKENFLLIDIGAEVTDISMIKKEIIQASISFPKGKNSLLRDLSISLGKSLDQVSSLFNLYSQGHADSGITKIINQSLIKTTEDWLKKFQNALVHISNDISIPSTIFLTGDDDVVDWFVETIRNEQFNQYTLTESKFKIIIINNTMLHGIATFEENVVRDRFIIIASIYISRFLK
ncbi:MAG: hypothetical protein NTZ44_03570 [Candidatus Nomurabacteria bacterium]|nr:hypothetical protein [Candidatus Nomurabacteria bacterium]